MAAFVPKKASAVSGLNAHSLRWYVTAVSHIFSRPEGLACVAVVVSQKFVAGDVVLLKAVVRALKNVIAGGRFVGLSDEMSQVFSVALIFPVNLQLLQKVNSSNQSDLGSIGHGWPVVLPLLGVCGHAPGNSKVWVTGSFVWPAAQRQVRYSLYVGPIPESRTLIHRHLMEMGWLVICAKPQVPLQIIVSLEYSWNRTTPVNTSGLRWTLDAIVHK